jgi:DNA-binding response OmpR family regulator
MAKKVLVVDDEKLIVKGIRFSLEQDGMEVDCAFDGEEALRLATYKLPCKCKIVSKADLEGGASNEN